MESAVTLGELSQMPIDRRCEFILNLNREELCHACAENPLHPRCAEPGFAQRLAWGLAFNVVGNTYSDIWPPQTPWSEVWEKMSVSAKTENGSASDAWLNHLAKSISCEHRDDWQPPECRPIDLKIAGAAYSRLVRWQEPFVLKVIKKKISGIGPDEDDLVNRVFLNAFKTYWSPKSNQRFQGTSRISTFLHTIAWRVCADYQKSRNPDHEETLLPETLPAGSGPLSPTEADELRQRFKACLRKLKPHQAIVYLLVKRRKIAQKELALRFKVSGASISQWLTSAELEIEKCLAEAL